MRTREGQMAREEQQYIERTLALLPLYSTDRKNLYIERLPMNQTLVIRLIDRRTERPVPGTINSNTEFHLTDRTSKTVVH